MASTPTATLTELGFSLRHLYAEMARLDILLQKTVAALASSRNAENQMRGLVISSAEIDQLFTHKPDETVDSTFAAFDRGYRQAEASVQKAQDAAEAEGLLPRLVRLRHAFRLNIFEYDAFLLCLAPSLDLRYERIFGYIQDDVTLRRPTVNAILQVLVGESEDRLRLLPAFLKNNRLLQHRLVRTGSEGDDPGPLLSRQLVADECVVAWLLGQYEPDARLQQFIELHLPLPTEEDRLLSGDAWETVSGAINGQTLALFHGPDMGVQIATARLLAASADLPLMTFDLSLAVAAGLSTYEALSTAIRDARLTGAMLFIQGWDVCLTSITPAPDLVKLLFGALSPVIVSSEKEWHSNGVERADSILRITLKPPTYRQRLAFWKYYLDNIHFPVVEGLDVQPIASQFALTSRQIQDSVATARDTALQRKDIIQRRDLISAARTHSSPNLSGLAQKIEPRYDWDDLVVPDDQKAMLREMVQTVKGRGVVMEEWGVGRKLKTSAGVTVLFAGPPGTGKTMAAEVITNDLGLDLYKLDLSMVVSKYIGETEKNLGRIFDEAQSSSAVLFFDEADAIFGKRSEVKDSHDRYANMEVSYLLQRMEQYDGVTILATNLRANMDEAFTRRMQFIVDFPFPDEDERLYIWQTLFPVDLPQAADIDLRLFASRFKLAGGNIRNIIVSAAYLAAANGGQVTMDHLLHTTRRELQKMGRLVTDMDLTY
ncbi:MAG: ATP-binding protein [Chloroflexi bacterium]|nr:ATP-binding protein [Chloroflexota bacterium]